ncbi:MAG: ThiF family adenylyltransferase [Planctomycetaceae bacterium]|nr:ThiF family adenylyltransferase [Planctomycetaceae bacterium]
MDFSRIRTAMDVDALQTKKVTLFGAGASVGLSLDLTRCGVSHWQLLDPDVVGFENPQRQGHDPGQIGQPKVEAVATRIREINPSAVVETVPLDVTGWTDEQTQALFAATDLFIAATDSFVAQAFVNRMALLRNVPAVFIGIYAGGLGAEVVWIDPRRRDCCFRCLCSKRYEVQKEAHSGGKSLDPNSEGADIFSVRIPDAVAGQLVIGLLTLGAPNRYGRLIEQLGDRQFLQFSLSPDFKIAGRDILKEKLGIANDVESYFAWNSIAIADPDRGQLPCPDCETYRSHGFEQVDEAWRRVKPIEQVNGTQTAADLFGARPLESSVTL